MRVWPKETKCSRWIANALTDNIGGYAVRFEPARIPGHHFSAENSWPDIWWLIDKTTVFVELKMGSGQLQPRQRIKLRDLRRGGYYALVVRLRPDSVIYEDPDGTEILRTDIRSWREIALDIDTLTVGIGTELLTCR